MWTSERVESLKKRWSEGHSASEIAGALGGVTRNAVIGKVHRLGLAWRCTIHRRSSSHHVLSRNTVRWPRPELTRRDRSAALKPAFSPVEQPATEPTIVTSLVWDLSMLPALRVDLLDLQISMCRWPIGDPRDGNFYFCGHPKFGNSSYCAVHSRMAFRAAERRAA